MRHSSPLASRPLATAARPARTARHLSLLACLLTCALFLGACKGESAPEESEGAHSRERTLRERVELQPLQHAEERTLITLPAEVVSAPDAAWHLSPPTVLRLESWLVAVGDTLQAGDALAETRSLEVGDLRATLEGARREAAARDELVTQLEGALEAGAVSSAEVASARAARDEARGRARTLSSQIASRRGEDGNAWLAPVDGVVSEIMCAPGEVVSPDEHCLRIVDSTRSEVRIQLPQRLLSELQDAQEASFVTASTSAEPLRVELARRSPELDRQTRSLPLYFRPTEAGRSLSPGMAGRLSLLSALDEPAFAVPTSSLTLLDGQDHIYVDRGDHFEAVEIMVLDRREGRAVIRSDALREGDTFVSRGAFLLKSVEVMSGQEGGHH